MRCHCGNARRHADVTKKKDYIYSVIYSCKKNVPILRLLNHACRYMKAHRRGKVSFQYGWKLNRKKKKKNKQNKNKAKKQIHVFKKYRDWSCIYRHKMISCWSAINNHLLKIICMLNRGFVGCYTIVSEAHSRPLFAFGLAIETKER